MQLELEATQLQPTHHVHFNTRHFYFSMTSTNEQYHSFMNVQGAYTGTVVVPQLIYRTAPGYRPLHSTGFCVNGVPGVKLADALTSNLNHLDRAGELVELGPTMAKKVTLRINWPGYDNWSDTIHLLDHGYDANQITRAKLAYEIARKVRTCLQDLATLRSRDATQDWWAARYPIERLVLLELRHVAAGSWQPVFAAFV
ncbi:hypothetical protein BDW22DRAFT_1487138 [Trametopsis cervina]|nr:hypothetical protein BDW22DRAFT_1487138 [Trametopsis cervina]